MKLVVGLGNPGADFADTYHNIGFNALDSLSARFSAPDFCEKGNALLSSVSAGGQKIIFCKPLTYMNLSGDAVVRVSGFYKIEPRDILVMYDDIDLHKGTVRARERGSAGTHNGMRDIVNKLGSTDFARVRIGTGLKPDYMDLKAYVMMRAPQSEKPIISAAISAACDFAEAWIYGKQWQTLTVTADA